MGDDVVIDGPTGAVLHRSEQGDEGAVRAEIVGRSLHDLLAMVSVWLLGALVFTETGDSIETREIPSRVKGLQSTLDPVGAAAGNWGIALMDHWLLPSPAEITGRSAWKAAGAAGAVRVGQEWGRPVRDCAAAAFSAAQPPATAAILARRAGSCCAAPNSAASERSAAARHHRAVRRATGVGANTMAAPSAASRAPMARTSTAVPVETDPSVSARPQGPASHRGLIMTAAL